MTWADSISASDRDLMRRMTIALAILVIVAAGFTQLRRLYAQKFFDATGRAQWIWAQHPLNRDLPVAFFAVRDFELPERRLYARLKVLGDPEYTLFVNGREVSGRRVGVGGEAPDLDRTLARYDISELVVTGQNRIVVAVRSPQGFGGLIAALDLGPETQNWLVTDATWRIYRKWDPALLTRDARGIEWERPLVIGEPPIGRWNYLAVEAAPRSERSDRALEAASAVPTVGLIPRIRTRGGVAVAVNERHESLLFDFGFTRGQIRMTLERPREESSSIPFRLANHASELGIAQWNLRPVVFAPGETSVTTPEAYGFRYVMVFDRSVRVEVIKQTAPASQ